MITTGMVQFALRSAVALHYIQNRVLAEAQPSAMAWLVGGSSLISLGMISSDR
jgi:hypothetical protein